MSLEVVDVGLEEGNRSSLPLRQLTPSNFSGEEYKPYDISSIFPVVTILSCPKQVRSPSYIDVEPCMAVKGYYLYAVIDARAWDIEDFCTITTSILAAEYLGKKIDASSRENRTISISYNDNHNAMANGFFYLSLAAAMQESISLLLLRVPIWGETMHTLLQL